MTHHEHADLEQHTDEELREGIKKADEELSRIDQENSREAYEANRRQREALAAELEKRES